MKISYGISSKLAKYIKNAENSGGVYLYTAANEEAAGGAYVYCVNAHMAIRVALADYKLTLQPHTCMDAPAVGESRTVTGRERGDCSGFVDVVEKGLRGEKKAFMTGFTWEQARKNGKDTPAAIFSADDGTPVMVDKALLALFENVGEYTASYSGAPLALHKCGDFGAVEAIVMPMWIAETEQAAMDAICRAACAKRGIDLGE